MQEPARRRAILKKYENALRRAIATDLSEQKVLLAAEKVREAQLSLFKGQRKIALEISNPTNSERNHINNLSSKERSWKTKTIAEIIEAYRF